MRERVQHCGVPRMSALNTTVQHARARSTAAPGAPAVEGLARKARKVAAAAVETAGAPAWPASNVQLFADQTPCGPAKSPKCCSGGLPRRLELARWSPSHAPVPARFPEPACPADITQLILESKFFGLFACVVRVTVRVRMRACGRVHARVRVRLCGCLGTPS